MDLNFLSKTSLIIFLATLVLGCGGGGDSAPTLTPTLTPPPTPTPTYSLKITEDNAGVIAYGSFYSEAVLQLSDSVLSIFLDYYGNISSGAKCKLENVTNERGTTAVNHHDSNNDFFVNVGERVTIHYDSCFDHILDDDVTGSVDLEIIKFLIDENNSITLEANLSTQNFQLNSIEDGTSGVVSGDFKVTYNLTDDEVITVESDDEGFFKLTQEGLSESAENFKISKITFSERISGNYENKMSFRGDFDSSSIGGNFTCESDFIYFAGNYPTSSDVRCSGDNSSINISNDTVSLDDNGDSSYEVLGEIIWGEVFEGYIHSDSNRMGRVQEIASDLKVGRKSLSTRQIFEDKLNNRILILTTELDVMFPNSLVAIDINSHEIIELMSFNSAKIKSIIVSYDASQYCSVLEESDVFTCYNLSDNSEIFNLNIDYGYESGDPNFDEAKVFICDAVAANQTNDYYALRLGKQGYLDCTNIVLVQSGQQLPISFKNVPSNDSSKIGGLQDSIIFAPDDKSIFLDGKGYTVINLFSVPINGNGFGELLNISLSSDSSHDLSIVDGSLFDWRSMYDPSNFTKLGKFERKDRSGWSNHYSAKFFEIDENKAYFFDEDNKIIVYSYEQFLPTAEFPLELPRDDNVTEMSATESHLLIFSHTGIYAIPKKELNAQEKYNKACSLVIESGNEYWGSMDCQFSNAIYDSVRNRVYGALPSVYGINGNSVVIIDLESKETIDHVYVGSEPTSMSLSGNKEKLYVGFDDSDKIIEIDLDTFKTKDTLVIAAKNVTPDFLNGDIDLVVGLISFMASSPFSDEEFIVGVDEGFLSNASYLSFYHSDQSEITESFLEGTGARKVAFLEKNRLIGIGTYGGVEEFDISCGAIEALDTQYYSPSGYGSPIFDELTISSDKLLYDIYGNVFDMVNGELTSPFNLDGGQYSYGSLILDEVDENIYFVSHDLHVDHGVSISKYSLITGEWLGGLNEDISKKSRKSGVSFITNNGDIGATNSKGKLFLIPGSSLK
ncbi:hypothetical protein H4J56_06140 [Colwellia sp. BRX8-4]|jgi:hypothetical protein|uniref:YncE family protein n=1 Tax=Colwellia sp. BRX8-4 TaxID=2759836 RepID=UPI0015F46C0B|nr:hypothetical protein [Colwellia sp. BRX8-4]MBA6371006.1 hypothetical protein [Colwellia sp. BRX8-4]